MKKKYAMTLLEIMIVIFIIGIVGSVIGYNMRGSLDKGKAFKTEIGARKLYDIVQLEIDIPLTKEDKSLTKDALSEKIKELLKNSDLVSNPDALMTDGWGNQYIFDKFENDDLQFHSGKYDAYCTKKNIKPEYPWQDKDPSRL